MSTPGRHGLLATKTIKSQDPQDQAEALRSLVPRYLERAGLIRKALENRSGRVVSVSVHGTDEEIVLLALLTAVADDIISVPDSRRQRELLALQEQAVGILGLEIADLRFFIENLARVMDTLAG